MTKTRDDLVKRALKDLGVLPQGQQPSDEEYDSVDDHIDPLIEELSARDIFYVPDLAAIDEAAFLPLGHCLAWACASEFGAHNDPALASLAQQAEISLLKIKSQRPTYAVLRSEYF